MSGRDPVPSLPSPSCKPTGVASDLSSPAAVGGAIQSSASPPAQPSAPPPAVALNSRSCVLCRRRKVKCDKRSPCSNCSKAGSQCNFPLPGRAPRRNRRPPDNELLSRLRKLEGVVEELSGGAEDGDSRSSRLDGKTLGVAVGRQQEGDLEHEVGRLVLDQGKSRYVSSSFWTSLSDEVKGMKEILDEYSEDEEDVPSPLTGSPSSVGAHNEFIFGHSSLVTDVRQYHPSPEQIDFFWKAWVKNVDPMVKILHKPTIERVLEGAKSSVYGINKSTEALMFAIFLAALTSVSAEDYRDATGEAKDADLAKYRFATEQALARANFLMTHELTTLQAFVIFLVVVRRQDQTRFTWTLTGLAVRIAQSLGLHRDGSKFHLSPFETEMRRRLWWHVLSLDIRSSQDHASDPSIAEFMYDTEVPLNINDDQMSPDSDEPLTGNIGCTEMTFCLIRYEVVPSMRRLNYNGPSSANDKRPEPSEEDKIQLIEATHRKIESRYLQHCDTTIALSRVTVTAARLILAKMWLMLHHPFQRQKNGEEAMPQAMRDRLFETSMQVIEYARGLETDKILLQWGWLLRTYAQWHAVVFLLAELCVRTKGELVDRAWRAIDGVVHYWGEQVKTPKGDMLWRLVKRLMVRAQQARETELARSRAIASLDSPNLGTGMPQYSSYISNAPQMTPDTSINSSTNPATPGVTAPGINNNILPPTSTVSYTLSNPPYTMADQRALPHAIHGLGPNTGLSYAPNRHPHSQSQPQPEPPPPLQSPPQYQGLAGGAPSWSMDDGMYPVNPLDSGAGGQMNWEDVFKDIQMFEQGNPEQQGGSSMDNGWW